MPNAEEYDLVVIGSGRARFFAWSLGSQGKRAPVVERRYVTGSCPSIACLPSKYLIHVAKVAHYFHKGSELGIIPGDWKVGMPTFLDCKRKTVDVMVALNLERYRENGAELVMGQGRFIGSKTIEVVAADGGTRTLRGDVVVINTGSRSRIDPFPASQGAADEANHYKHLANVPTVKGAPHIDARRCGRSSVCRRTA